MTGLQFKSICGAFSVTGCESLSPTSDKLVLCSPHLSSKGRILITGAWMSLGTTGNFRTKSGGERTSEAKEHYLLGVT